MIQNLYVGKSTLGLAANPGGNEIYGALYLDPAGVAALLELSGPVEVEGLAVPLDSATAEQFLLSDVYVQFPDEDSRDQVLQNAIESLFDALTARDLPGPRTVADVLSPVVRGNHLSFSVENTAAEDLLARLGATGAFPRFDEDADLLAIKTANAAPNKLDTYLQRSTRYEIDLDPATGAVNATVTVSLTNTAPASGLPVEVGTNRGIVDGAPGAPPPGTAILNVGLWTGLHVTEAVVDDVSKTLIGQ